LSYHQDCKNHLLLEETLNPTQIFEKVYNLRFPQFGVSALTCNFFNTRLLNSRSAWFSSFNDVFGFSIFCQYKKKLNDDRYLRVHKKEPVLEVQSKSRLMSSDRSRPNSAYNKSRPVSSKKSPSYTKPLVDQPHSRPMTPKNSIPPIENKEVISQNHLNFNQSEEAQTVRKIYIFFLIYYKKKLGHDASTSPINISGD
jgi:hypothetical protein